MAITNAMTVVVIAMVLGGAARTETGTVTGTVQTSDEGEPMAIPGVRVTLTCGHESPSTVISDEQGAFRFDHRASGECRLDTEVQGFHATSLSLSRIAPEPADVRIRLEPQPLSTGLLVTGTRFDEGGHAGDRPPAAARPTCAATPRDAGGIWSLRDTR